MKKSDSDKFYGKIDIVLVAAVSLLMALGVLMVY